MVERFIVLDLDRTLLDTDAYVDLLVRALLPEKLHNEVRAKLAGTIGQSFDGLAYILQRAGLDYQAATNQVMRSLNNDNGLTLPMPGAAELIAFLDTAGEHFGILTTGTVPNQQLKLKAFYAVIGVIIPAEITSTPDKSIDFIENRREGSGFNISPTLSGAANGLHARTVVIIDDKQTNLTADHPGVIAIHVPLTREEQAPGHTLQSVQAYLQNTASKP